MEMRDRRAILNYPEGRAPIAGSFPHIFPSIESLPNLADPFFHMATVTPDEGIRCIYSLIFENSEPVSTPEDDLPVKSLVILALESLFLHPFVFHQVLYHFYNSFTSGRLFAMDHAEIEEYARPECESRPGCCVGLVQFPGDITPEAEVGRLQHFAFACFRVLPREADRVAGLPTHRRRSDRRHVHQDGPPQHRMLRSDLTAAPHPVVAGLHPAPAGQHA
jgi:hypothetical protein